MGLLHLAVSALFAGVFSPALATSPKPPPPPSQDPFYAAPPRFENHSPGDILRIRTAPATLSGSIPNSSAAYHIVYRTTDTRYRPSWAITTLLLPPSYNPSSTGPVPLLSYQLAYNSPDIDASPSYDYSALTAPGGPVALALGRGWLVSVPDFEGPTASFGAGVQAGHATIDNIRAVLSLATSPGKKKIGPITKYAMYGYSGGCIATEFAAELAVQYAPEMDFAGAVCGGLVPDVLDPDGGISSLNETPYVGDLPAFFVGSLNRFPQAYQFLVDSLKESGPYNRTGFLAVKDMTILEAFAYFAGQDIWQYFVQGAEVIDAPILKKTLQRNSIMGYHGVPPMPMLMHQAIGDKFSPIEITDQLVERYCRAGAVIEYQKNTVGGHIAEITNGTPRALEWLVKVLEGPGVDVLTGVCETKTVTVGIVDASDF
ncbi:lipase 1 precursor [Naviculisporaceae sp. PSN 640]